MPEEEFIKKQVGYFNKILVLFIAILVIMSVIIASLIILKFEEIKIVQNLDNTIHEALQKYGPDREQQTLILKTIQNQNNSQIAIDINNTAAENNQLLKQLLVTNSSSK